MGGGRSVPVCSGLFAFGCCFGDDAGGEGVTLRSVVDVTHLVLSLQQDDKCFIMLVCAASKEETCMCKEIRGLSLRTAAMIIHHPGSFKSTTPLAGW